MILKYPVFKKLNLAGIFQNQYRNNSGVKNNKYFELQKPLGENRKELANKLHVQLFQYSYCPFCVKVRSYLNINQIPFSLTEVDRASKAEIQFTSYKMVPITIINRKEV